MKRLITTLFGLNMFLTTVALAGDVEDVKAVVQNYYASLNSGNMDAWSGNFQSGHIAFGGGGTFLEETTSLQEQRANRQAALDAGVRYNLQPLHNDVRVYGNLTAVTTRYGVGTITQADGTTRQVNNRITDVWAKQGEQWKVVHRHVSPLVLSTTPQIADRFVGTWRLVDFERRGPDGDLLSSTNPYRKGLLIYTATGHFSHQLTRAGRQTFSGRASGEEAQEALYSYIAYYGTFTVNEGQGAVTYHRQGHLIPSRVTEGLRYYSFMGNRLMLTAPGAGERMTTTLTWERIE